MRSTTSTQYFHTFGEQHEVVPCLEGRVRGAGVDGLEGGLEGPPNRELAAVLNQRVVEEIGELPGNLIWTKQTNDRSTRKVIGAGRQRERDKDHVLGKRQREREREKE